jgi:PAT family beta-lactamase induction signal transducer AmpG
MNLGVILPGAASGWIQEQLGYRSFFLWVLVSAIPAVVLSRFIPIRGGAPPPVAREAVAGAEGQP